jgi:hypothetical protein
MVATLSALACLTAAACGYTGEGTLADGLDPDGALITNGGEAGSSGNAGGDGAAPGDGAPLPATDGSPPPTCATPTCTLPTAPAGWQLVLLESSRADVCPAGFDSVDSIESPVAAANACTCAACVTTGTNCSTGPIPTAYDNGGGACGTTGASCQTNAGNCNEQNGNFGQDARIDPPTAVRGTCTSASVSNRANVATDARRVCTRQASTCSDRACGAPASMKACIAAPGDVACPAGGPTTKHVLGSDFTLACAGCGCSISTATCGGELDFYPQGMCNGNPVKLTVGVCTGTGGAGFQSTKWKPVIASEVCATVPGAATTPLTGPQTICCP